LQQNNNESEIIACGKIAAVFAPFHLCNSIVQASSISTISMNRMEWQQNCPPLLMGLLTSRLTLWNTTRVSLCCTVKLEDCQWVTSEKYTWQRFANGGNYH